MIGINLSNAPITGSDAPYMDARAYRSHKYYDILAGRKAFPVKKGWSYDSDFMKKTRPKTVYEIINQIDDIYELKKGKSFKDLCGVYVTFQLKALGIFSDMKSYCGNGNAWYNGVNQQHVSGNYILKKYPGTYCLENIIRGKGNSVYNVVVSFSKGRFGHVMFIHAILNGRIYFTDSYRFNNIEARKLHVLSIPAFKKHYANKGYKLIGALHFS